MFNLFSDKDKSLIGIDFGTSTIKAVELVQHGEKLELLNYGYFDLTGVLKTDDSKEQKLQTYEEKLKRTLNALVSKMNFQSKSVYVGMPGFSGLVVMIDFPEMKEEEIEKAIEYESHKYIPATINEVSISWEVIERKKDVTADGKDLGGKIKVLLVAAPKKEVDKYHNLISSAGLNMKAIELETFSIARSLVGNKEGSYIVVDIGSRATNIILIENGSVRVNRSIDAGGSDITTSISESMSISKKRAEMFKREEKDFLNSKESVIIVPVLELIAGEIKRIFSVYKEKNKDADLKGVVLSGGTSLLNGVDKFFSKYLDVSVEVGDPWKNISYDPKLKPFIEEMGASYAVAIGLAMMDLDKK